MSKRGFGSYNLAVLILTIDYQETMNFWKQTTHILSYFKDENFRGDKRLPSSFMSGFLEVRHTQLLESFL